MRQQDPVVCYRAATPEKTPRIYRGPHCPVVAGTRLGRVYVRMPRRQRGQRRHRQRRALAVRTAGARCRGLRSMPSQYSPRFRVDVRYCIDIAYYLIKHTEFTYQVSLIGHSDCPRNTMVLFLFVCTNRLPNSRTAAADRSDYPCRNTDFPSCARQAAVVSVSDSSTAERISTNYD
jgi:hypothetical protein